MKKILYAGILSMIIAQSILAQVSKVDNTILLVNNEPYFPFGIYTEGIYDNDAYLGIVDSIATSDMNTIWIESNAVDESTYETFYQKCTDQNLNTIVGLPIQSQFAGDFEYWLNFHTSFDNAIAWDILDDSNNFPVAEIINQKDQTISIDTSRVTSQSMYALGIVELFNTYTELPAMQGYPWGNGNDDLSDSYKTYSGFCDTVKMIGHVPIVNNQVFNWPEESYPSDQHLDCQTYLSILCGAKGIINYTYLDYGESKPISTTQQSLWNQLKQNATELSDATLQAYLLFGDYNRIKINDYSFFATWVLNDKMLCIAVNASAINSQQFDIDVSEFNPENKTNYFDYRPDYLNLDNQMILTGNIPPYGIAVYEFDKMTSSDLGIEEQSVVVYPNPSNGKLQIQGAPQYFELQILNENGQVIKEIESNGDQEIDLSNFVNGSYFIKMINKENQKIEVHKILML